MIERGQPNENTHTNPAFSDTLAKPAWKEIQRTSIEISNETLIPGEFGIKVVRGTFSCVLRKNKEACSIKLLKGTVLFGESVVLIDKLVCSVRKEYKTMI